MTLIEAFSGKCTQGISQSALVLCDKAERRAEAAFPRGHSEYVCSALSEEHQASISTGEEQNGCSTPAAITQPGGGQAQRAMRTGRRAETEAGPGLIPPTPQQTLCLHSKPLLGLSNFSSFSKLCGIKATQVGAGISFQFLRHHHSVKVSSEDEIAGNTPLEIHSCGQNSVLLQDRVNGWCRLP